MQATFINNNYSLQFDITGNSIEEINFKVMGYPMEYLMEYLVNFVDFVQIILEESAFKFELALNQPFIIFARVSLFSYFIHFTSFILCSRKRKEFDSS